jgi:hypothetical protein
MFFLRSNNPNDPRRINLRRHEKQQRDDHVTGNAGLDGFTRLSQADRESGHRPVTGMQPQPYGRFPVE